MTELSFDPLTQMIAIVDLTIAEMPTDVDEVADMLGADPVNKLGQLLDSAVKERLGLACGVEVSLVHNDIEVLMHADNPGASSVDPEVTDLVRTSVPTHVRDAVLGTLAQR